MTVDAISDLDLSYTLHSDHPGTQYKSRLKTGSANTNSAHTNAQSPPDPASRAVRANGPHTPRAVHVKLRISGSSAPSRSATRRPIRLASATLVVALTQPSTSTRSVRPLHRARAWACTTPGVGAWLGGGDDSRVHPSRSHRQVQPIRRGRRPASPRAVRASLPCCSPVLPRQRRPTENALVTSGSHGGRFPSSGSAAVASVSAVVVVRAPNRAVASASGRMHALTRSGYHDRLRRRL